MELEKDVFHKDYKSLYDVYTPGAQPPPNMEEWIHAYDEHVWVVQIWVTESKLIKIRTNSRPKITNGVLIIIDEDQKGKYLKCHSLSSIKSFEIREWKTPVSYRLAGRITDIARGIEDWYRVLYKKGEAKLVAPDYDWYI